MFDSHVYCDSGFNTHSLRCVRWRKRYTKKRAAEICGMSAYIYSRIENGKREPSKAEAENIANALEWPVKFFYNRDFIMIDIRYDWNTIH